MKIDGREIFVGRNSGKKGIEIRIAGKVFVVDKRSRVGSRVMDIVRGNMKVERTESTSSEWGVMPVLLGLLIVSPFIVGALYLCAIFEMLF